MVASRVAPELKQWPVAAATIGLFVFAI